MRVKLIGAALLGAALLVAGCESKPEPVHDIVSVSIWKVNSKWIEDGSSPEPCYRFSLRRVIKTWEEKSKHYHTQVEVDYKCVPTKAYESLNPGDEYIEQHWWTQ